jgi:soluble lytic murein transglycosylase-like protein
MVSTAYGRAFRAAARETGFPVALLVAVAWEESRMNPHARAGAGARGLIQLMPQTARMLGTSPDEPRASIRAGARYLSQLLKRFGGDLELALAAYNAGPTTVEGGTRSDARGAALREERPSASGRARVLLSSPKPVALRREAN